MIDSACSRRAWRAAAAGIFLLTLAGVLPNTADTRAIASTATVVVPGQVAPSVAKGMKPLRHHDPRAWININLGLPLRDAGGLQSLLDQNLAVPPTEFAARFAPLSSTVHAVESWARKHGLRIGNHNGDGTSILAAGRTSTIEKAFRVRVNDYPGGSGHVFYSIDRAPTVPSLWGIKAITGLQNETQPTYAGIPRLLPHSIDRPGSRRTAGFYPRDFRSMYDVDGTPPRVSPLTHRVYDGTNESIGIILWGPELNPADFQMWWQHAMQVNGSKPPMPSMVTEPVDPGCSTGNCCPDPSSNPNEGIIIWCVLCPMSEPTNCDDYHHLSRDQGQREVAQDVETVIGMAPDAHIKFFLAPCANTNPQCGQADVAGMANAVSMAAHDPSLTVVSNSWSGGTPATFDSYLVIARSAQHTFFFGSGDDGTHDGAVYPASSQNVVAVGGTSLTGASASGDTYTYGNELVWSYDIHGDAAGAGCSTTIDRDTWMTGQTGCSKRAVPDLSADADIATGAYIVYDNGSDPIQSPYGSGTSEATPLVTAMAALTAQYLHDASSPGQLGFFGARLYQLAGSGGYRAMFHDVTCGYNGYAAASGWDQATGWGSEDWWALTQAWAGSPPSGPSAPTYQWDCNDAAANPYVLNTVDCVGGTSSCDAAGQSGAILYSNTIASSWSQITTPSLKSIACPDSRTCFAVGASGLVYRYVRPATGSPQWTSVRYGGGDTLTGISCTDTTTCFITTRGGAILQLTDGSPPSIQQIFTAQGKRLYGLACLPTSPGPSCYATGSDPGGANPFVEVTHNGHDWMQATVLPSGIHTLLAIACPAVDTCYAVGLDGTIIDTTGSGAMTWTSRGSSSLTTADLDAIACNRVGGCYAGGSHGKMFVLSSGITWRSSSTPRTADSRIRGISCASTSYCQAVGDHGHVLTISGTASSWMDEPQSSLPWGSAGGTDIYLDAVSCVASVSLGQICYVVGEGGVMVADFGTATWVWQRYAIGAPSYRTGNDLNGLTCPSGTVCYGVGDGGLIIKSTDGGLTYQIQNPRRTTIDPSDPSENPLTSVSCADATHCVAVATSGALYYTRDGSSWTRLTPVTTPLYAVSCVPSGSCRAVGSPDELGGVILKTDQAVTDSNWGVDWTSASPTFSGSPQPLYGVTCVPLSSLTCFAVGGSGTILQSQISSGSETWTTMTSHTTADLRGIACVAISSSPACTAVGDGGTIRGLPAGGSDWQTRSNPVDGSLVDLHAVSCLEGSATDASTTHCIAVGGYLDEDWPGTAGTGMVLSGTVG